MNGAATLRRILAQIPARIPARIPAALLLAGALGAGSARAELAPPERHRAAGALVVATSPALAPMVRRAAAAFERRHPDRHVTVDARGSDIAMATLYTAQADLAVIGRDGLDNEIKAYAWIYGHPPVATPIAAGSTATPGLSPALAIRVAAGNPLRSITPDRIRAAFRIGAPAPTWRDLGATGPIAGRTVHIVMPDAESGTGRYLRHAMLADVVQFDWARVREIAAPGDAARDRAIDAAVARDPLALGFGTALATPGVRTVAVAAGTGTGTSTGTGTGAATLPGQPDYPYARKIMAYSPPALAAELADLIAALRAEHP